MALDTFAEAEALVDGSGPRPPGSEAERRAAQHVTERLRALGRHAQLEPFTAHPAWPAACALHAVLAVAGSVLAVSQPAPGAALVLVATVLTLVDAGALVPTTRRLLARRTSQNVVSWGDRTRPGALVLVAHCDSGRGRPAQGLRLPVPPLAAFAAALVVVFCCCLLRTAGVSGDGLTIVQFVATVGLVVAVPLLLEDAFAPPRAGENDNASGVALALALAERADPLHFGVHVVVTGSQKALAQGMRAFIHRHRHELARERTVILNLDTVGDGEARYTRTDGPLLVYRSHLQLVGLCDEIAEDAGGRTPRPLAGRSASDAHAARLAGLPALTITCRDGRGAASPRLDEQALASAETLCLELIRRLDAEIGPELSSDPPRLASVRGSEAEPGAGGERSEG